MGVEEGLLYGLQVALTPTNLLAALTGVLMGSLVGLLPGLGPVAGAAVLLPLTYTMGPTAGVIMIAGVYYGVMYGGSTTAVLLNIPGEAASVVAAFEGYELTKQGRPGPALGVIAIASFVAGTLSVWLVALIGPSIARVALAFGPAEYFALTFGGLLLLSGTFASTLAAGLLPLFIGLALATVGEDVLSGWYRFSFGSVELSRGFDLVSLAVGMFGIAELMRIMERGHAGRPVPRLRVRELVPTMSELRRCVPSWARGGLIGFGFGLLPGPSATLATFLSYRVEKAVSKGRALFGKGAVEGLAGPEAANNAAATSSIVPVLALGIPFSATLAIVFAALMVHGITPGPLIIEQRPDVFWGVIASMWVGNVMLLILNVPMIGAWVAFLKIKMMYLLPAVVVLASTGAYAVRQSYLDVAMVVVFGILGYALMKLRFNMAALLLGFILGPLVEKYFRASMVIARGDWTYLFTRPLAGALWALIIGGLLVAYALRLVAGHRRREAGVEGA